MGFLLVLLATVGGNPVIVTLAVPGVTLAAELVAWTTPAGPSHSGEVTSTPSGTRC